MQVTSSLTIETVGLPGEPAGTGCLPAADFAS